MWLIEDLKQIDPEIIGLYGHYESCLYIAKLYINGESSS